MLFVDRSLPEWNCKQVNERRKEEIEKEKNRKREKKLEQERFRSQGQLVTCRDSLVIHGQDHNLVVLLQHKNGVVPRLDDSIRGHCIKREEQNRMVISENRKRKERENIF